MPHIVCNGSVPDPEQAKKVQLEKENELIQNGDAPKLRRKK